MTCPNCGKPRDPKTPECDSCGIIYERYEEIQREKQLKDEEAAREAAEKVELDDPGMFSEMLRGVLGNKAFIFTVALLVAGGLVGLYYMQPTATTTESSVAVATPTDEDESQDVAVTENEIPNRQK